MDQTVTLNIDGRDVTVPPGTTVLEAAKRIGIEIPGLCYHEKLLPAGLCRLCLVEIEKMRGLQPACATIVRDGMVVHTDTPAVQHNRRMVLELLCTNHPLDCPVCDAAGDCRLQDYVFRYGRTDSRFVEEKRHKGKAIPLGPAVMLDQERCVLCQRCVRFCEEVLDDRQLAVFQRGAQARIATLPGRSFDSIFSGNVTELCPVGALTDRVARFKARSWEYQSTISTCALCPIGCRVTLDTRKGRLLRVRGAAASQVNNGWLCDLGRMGFGFVDHPDRLRQPLLRRNGALEPATWEEAFETIVTHWSRTLEQTGTEAIAALGSPRLTNEAAYLLAKLMRVAIGTNNITTCPEARLAPAQATLADLREADAIVLFLADPSEEAPITELAIRQALRRGARLFVIQQKPVRLACHARQVLMPQPGTWDVFLGGVLEAVEKQASGRLPTTWQDKIVGLGSAQLASLTGCPPAAAEDLAQALLEASRAIIVYGCGVHEKATLALLTTLAEATGAHLLGWSSGPNARGVADMGLQPNRLPGWGEIDNAAVRARCKGVWGVSAPRAPGLDEANLWLAAAQGDVRALYIVGADPLREGAAPTAIATGLAKVEFLVVQDAFLTPTAERAHVVLPAAVWAEEEGSYTNLAGQLGWQRAALQPLGEARPHWSIIAEIARRLNGEGDWQYASAAQVLAEVGRVAPAYAEALQCLQDRPVDVRCEYAIGGEPQKPSLLPRNGRGDLALITAPVLFDRDPWAGRAVAAAARADQPYVALHPADAASRGITAGSQVIVESEEGALRLQARVHAACQPGTAFIPENLGIENPVLLGAQPGVVVQVRVKPAS